MDLLTNASLLQDSIKFVTENKQNLSNKKENIKQVTFKDLQILKNGISLTLDPFTHSQ